MASGYYSPGDQEKDKALQSMLAWAQYQKTQGKNFLGQELKVDPSKGKGAAAQANVVNAKQMPGFTDTAKNLSITQGTGRYAAQKAMHFDKVNKALMTNAFKANEAVGSLLPEVTKTGLKIGPEVFKAATPEIAAKVSQQFAAGAASKGMNIAATTGSTAAASTGLQAAASTAMPYLLAAQLALGFLGSKKDEEGWLGIRPSGNPWGAAGGGGTGVVGY